MEPSAVAPIAGQPAAQLGFGMPDEHSSQKEAVPNAGDGNSQNVRERIDDLRKKVEGLSRTFEHVERNLGEANES